MPIVHDKANFRPAPTLAKKPTEEQRQKVLDAFAREDAARLRYPEPPEALDGNEVAREHFGKLVKQMHPDHLTNLILLDYLTEAALVWSAMRALIRGLTSGTIASTAPGSTGSTVKSPQFEVLDRYARTYQSLLLIAGLKGVNAMTSDEKAMARAARAGKADYAADTGLPTLTGNVHKDKGVMSLLARAKSQ